MKQFIYYRDEHVKVWIRSRLIIEADTDDQAREIAEAECPGDHGKVEYNSVEILRETGLILEARVSKSLNEISKVEPVKYLEVVS